MDVQGREIFPGITCMENNKSFIKWKEIWTWL